MPVVDELLSNVIKWMVKNRLPAELAERRIIPESLGLGGVRATLASAGLGLAKWFGLPARVFANSVADGVADAANDLVTKGILDDGVAALLNSRAYALKQLVQMVDDATVSMTLARGKAEAFFKDLWDSGFNPQNRETVVGALDSIYKNTRILSRDGGFEIDFNGLSGPAVQLARAGYTSWNNLRKLLPELDKAINPIPQVLDPDKAIQYSDLLEGIITKQVGRIIKDPSLAGIFTPLGKTVEEQARNATSLLIADMLPGRVVEPGVLGGAARLVLRRMVRLPDELRMDPYYEAVIGLLDEMSYYAQASKLGVAGANFDKTMQFVRGHLEDSRVVENMLKNVMGDQAREVLQRISIIRSMGVRRQEDDLLNAAAELVEHVARATTGAHKEDAFTWAFRNGFAALGAIVMMPLSAIANTTQVMNEIVTKGVAPFLRAMRNAISDPDTAKALAVALGQSNVAFAGVDLLRGAPFVNKALENVETRALISLIDPRWWASLGKAVVTPKGKFGFVKGLRSVSEEMLKAYGFAPIEGWNRALSILTTHEELKMLQRRLLADPNDAYAIRKLLTYYPVKSVDEFLKLKLPDDPKELLRTVWDGDPANIARINPLAKLYWHGVDQSQFSYTPMDFPLAFSNPILGSVILQFRRFSYSQASKVVKFALNELSDGNPIPLLYMAAAVPTLGHVVDRVRRIASGRDVVLVDGTPRIVEEPPVDKARKVRGPFGHVLTPEEVEILRSAASIGIMGLIGDILMSVSEGSPLLTSSWGVGIFPAEVFTWMYRATEAAWEALTGGEYAPGKERFPRVREFVARTVPRMIPFWGRIIGPHVPHLMGGRMEYERLREFARRAFLSGDLQTFNGLQRILTEKYYAPVTMDDLVSWVYRQRTMEMGVTVPPRPGDPGYLQYTLQLRRQRKPAPEGITPESPELLERVERRTWWLMDEGEEGAASP